MGGGYPINKRPDSSDACANCAYLFPAQIYAIQFRAVGAIFYSPGKGISDFEIYAFVEIRKAKSGKYKSEKNRPKAVGITTGDTSTLGGLKPK